MTAPRRRNGASIKVIDRSCETKRRYPDEHTARAVGMNAAETRKQRLYTYRCKFCRGWHLTKNGRINGERSSVHFYAWGKYRTKDAEVRLKADSK